MSKHNVETLLEAGGKDPKIQAKYDLAKNEEEFVAIANADGYEFTVDELNAVIGEAGDSFEITGFPPRRIIWWK
ncbi:MAG: Nif11-like leader peptide family natural product precursor [Limnospira sp.]